MKRGFLINAQEKKDKARKRAAAQAQARAHDATPPTNPTNPSTSSAQEDKKEETPATKENADATDRRTDDLARLDLHTVPKWFRDEMRPDDTRNRVIFRYWPRDPNGQVIKPSPLRGKEAPNGMNLWGATLYDFYRTRRIPDSPYLSTISTGSRLAKTMREFGELEHAKDEIAWADEEADPKELPPCDIGRLVMDHDFLNAGFGGVPFEGFRPRPKLEQRIPFHLLPKKLIVHDPWNLLTVSSEDFDSDSEQPERPKREEPKPWTEMKDITRIYTLSLSEAGEAKVRESRDAAEKETKELEGSREIYRFMAGEVKEGSTDMPLVHAILPPRRAPRMELPEAHVYISPVAHLGEGHHSAVYKVELELPKDMLMEERICENCLSRKVHEAVVKISEERVEAKRKAKENANEAGASETQPDDDVESVWNNCGKFSVEYESEPRRTLAFVDDETDRWEEDGLSAAAKAERDSRTSRDASRNKPAEEPKDAQPTQTDKGKGKAKEADASPAEKTKSANKETYLINPSVVHQKVTYEGHCLQLHPDIEWQSAGKPPVCEHFESARGFWHAYTRVLVAAKLSKQNDAHLAREARSYQLFPDHFFQHWSGYNVMAPLHDPVPVMALVPQFYGYYVPDPAPAAAKGKSEDEDEDEDEDEGGEKKSEDGNEAGDKEEGQGEGKETTEDDMNMKSPGAEAKEQPEDPLPDYLSPILLLEHCGVPIDVDTLCADDRNECASLLLRFHHEGWLHNSFAERNILVQAGPITDWPLGRMFSDKYSFRLIDFGRSAKYERSLDRAAEESEMARLLKLMHFAET